jgi:plastocyanin
MKGLLWFPVLLLAIATPALPEELHLQAKITHQKDSRDSSNAGVVVWLTPIGQTLHPAPLEHVKLTQKNKQFVPHLLVITAGTTVEFPNLDPFFHNVFSLYKGKRFDLGLYEAGSSRSVKFERPGVSFIFCNIHPEMSAAVMVLSTPYFAVTNAAGEAILRNVPAGRYRMDVWYERSTPEALQPLSREIKLPIPEALHLEIGEAVSDKTTHKNKYGQDYDRPKSYNPE